MIKNIKNFSSEIISKQAGSPSASKIKHHKSKRVAIKDKVHFSKTIPPYEMANPENQASYFTEALNFSRPVKNLAEMPKATAFTQLAKTSGYF